MGSIEKKTAESEARVIEPKTTARLIARRTLSKLAPGWIAQASTEITARVLTILARQSPRSVGVFLSTKSEPQTQTLIETLLAQQTEVFAPRALPGRAAYEFVRLTAVSDTRPGPHGILEPAGAERCTGARPEVILVPLLAFDACGRRLGRGGGHYDRLLAGYKGTAIGLAFECQRMTVVPSAPHDQPLSIVVTEQNVITAAEYT